MTKLQKNVFAVEPVPERGPGDGVSMGQVNVYSKGQRWGHSCEDTPRSTHCHTHSPPFLPLVSDFSCS